MSERLPKHLDDALYAARLALRFLDGKALEEYLSDELLRSAVERQVEIVGEACRLALDDSSQLRERLPDSAKAVAMRNRLAHGYDTVDHALVFTTVTKNFPPLVGGLERELAALS
ncbi:MAG: hypothetical protein AD742_15480 [Methylibium sp. NZG]|nr:MAG: hypothetical protein AD742_15480 [Methylibium sp. NZG]